MIAYSYNGLKENEHQKFIYRIIPKERFFELIEKKEIAFINPLRWDDPYETILYKRPHQLEDGSTRTFEPILNNIFGSCWTLNYNTDFGWKVYSPNKDGIQIKCKISEIYDYFQYLKEDKELVSFQIGKIIYLKSKALRNKINSTHKVKIFEYLMNLSLFYKRYNFRHEREVRILLRFSNSSKSELMKLRFEPNKLIHSIMLDPRMDDDEV